MVSGFLTEHHKNEANSQTQTLAPPQWAHEKWKILHVTGAKRGKTHVNNTRWLFILLLIGWVDSVSSFEPITERSKSIQTQAIADY